MVSVRGIISVVLPLLSAAAQPRTLEGTWDNQPIVYREMDGLAVLGDVILGGVAKNTNTSRAAKLSPAKLSQWTVISP